MANTRDASKKLKSCRLFELPAELRDTIFSLVLTHHQSLTLSRTYKITERPRRYLLRATSWDSIQLAPNFLVTCKQIHDEATPALYGMNTLYFPVDYTKPIFKLFLSTIGTSAIYLRKIVRHGEHTKELMRSNFVELRKISPVLSSLALGPVYLEKFTPEQMALALRPLLCTADKKGKADARTKDTDVLDKLKVHDGENVDYIDEVKTLLRTMLK